MKRRFDGVPPVPYPTEIGLERMYQSGSWRLFTGKRRTGALIGIGPTMNLAATTRLPVILRSIVTGVLITAGILTVAVVMMAGLAAAQQQPDPIIVNFDDYPANRVGTPSAAGITDFYRASGLVFVRPVTALIYNADSTPADPDFARSGSTVITTCYAAEFCSNNIEMELLSAHQRIRLWVGYDGQLRQAANLVMIGFDRDRTPVTRAVVSLGPTAARLPVDIPLEISDPDGRIGYVQLTWADDSRFLSGLSVDDIELTPFVPTPSAEFERDLVQLNADDGPVQQPIRLINTGTVEIEVAAVDIEVEGGADPTGRFDVDGSGCLTVLERDSSCQVLVIFAAEDNGTRLARVIARDSAGAVLAVTTLEGTFSAAVTDTTDTTAVPDDTAVPDTTVVPDDTAVPDDTGAGTGDDTTGGGDETTATGTGETGDRTEALDPAAVSILVIAAILIVGLTITIRRFRRRRSPADRPPPARPPIRADNRPERHHPQPRPEITVRPGDGPHAVTGDDGPLVTIRAVIGAGRTAVTERQPTGTQVAESRTP